MTAYDALFDQVFTRVDPERAHDLGFHALRAATPVTRAAEVEAALDVAADLEAAVDLLLTAAAAGTEP